MADARITPLKVNEPEGTYRYTRAMWEAAGVDNHMLPPAQDPDKFEVLSNIMPPATNILKRRWGYRPFRPQLEQGGGDENDYVLIFDSGEGADVTFDVTPPFPDLYALFIMATQGPAFGGMSGGATSPSDWTVPLFAGNNFVYAGKALVGSTPFTVTGTWAATSPPGGARPWVAMLPLIRTTGVVAAVQTVSAGGVVGGALNLVITAPVTAGNSIMVAIASSAGYAYFNTPPPDWTCSDNQGNTYTSLGSTIGTVNDYASSGGIFNPHNQITFFYAKNCAAGATTVTITGTQTIGEEIRVSEMSGLGAAL